MSHKKMSKPRVLVFVGAHPDDETYGIGGTLAHYATSGVTVYYVCATRGEVGSVSSEDNQGYATLGDRRWAELKCAAQILGLVDIKYLGYRDSGMPGSIDNNHPDSLFMAPPNQVTERVVEIFRELRPDVVITHDPIGGYGHPDHIAIHNATVNAFYASGDTGQYSAAGPVYQPQKLYFSVFPRRLLKMAVRFMPLLGQDPHRFGHNKDVDLVTLADVTFPVHTTIRLSRPDLEIRNEAMKCYKSQASSGPPRAGMLRVLNMFFGKRDCYMLACPFPDGSHETDLFEGVL